jgi:2-dehydro-3-deoxy-D-gluconate 5-dehydrogenase
MSPFDLTGRVAFITGGNGGIGKGIAEGMAKAGAAVAIAGRSRDKLDAAARELGAHGTRVAAIECDVMDLASVQAAIARTVAELGGLHIVVNNAGINAIAHSPEAITPEDWNRVLLTNLTSAFNVCTTALPHFQKAGGGQVINISSMMAVFGGRKLAAYAASKTGLEGYTRSLAVAWAQHNFQANAIRPGWIATDMTRRSRSTPHMYEGIIDRTPARRYGTPADLAGPAVFLASGASDFVTGAMINVDGGYAVQGTSDSIGL